MYVLLWMPLNIFFKDISCLIYNLLLNPNPIFGELPKYIMQYLVTAWYKNTLYIFLKAWGHKQLLKFK